MIFFILGFRLLKSSLTIWVRIWLPILSASCLEHYKFVRSRSNAGDIPMPWKRSGCEARSKFRDGPLGVQFKVGEMWILDESLNG